MTLGELVESIRECDEDSTIFVADVPVLEPSTPAVLVPEEREDEAPEGMRYFLEVFIAWEVLVVWSANRGGAEPDSAQKFEAVVWYAENDAYLPEN
ncbi:hypothetical protein [Crossiella cryophila]|uniref:Uncharacterized protein n=1 Tax=Crossiella cryophila TaxID=43355 RepID=A0A7W7CJT0_9PSEU|nr:hypothetical protein [Crossiella cryophila]MBB4682440.1 hypothetical protein [Crossiella cryophila]